MNISVKAETNYVAQQSDVKRNRFVFSYTITIINDSIETVQLLSRHWLIHDANKKTEEIFGEGVIGEKPIILPGNSYTYSSGAVLDTEIGTMEGRYFFISKQLDKPSSEFEIKIPKFVLSVPRTIH